MRADSSLEMWPAVKSSITIEPSGVALSATRFMRKTTSRGPTSSPWLAASIGARPV